MKCDFLSTGEEYKRYYVREAKSMWKKLRDGHRQALKKKKTTTGQAAMNNVLWKYEKQMDFLVPHLTNRQRSTNASNSNSAIPIDDAQAEENSGVESPEDEFPQTTVNTTRINKRKCDKATSRDLLRQEILKMKPKENTALQKFFSSMCDETSSLPEYLQIQVQRGIFDVVLNAREANLHQKNINQNSSSSDNQNYEVVTPNNGPYGQYSPEQNTDHPDDLKGFLVEM